jgi:hypothetical protein
MTVINDQRTNDADTDRRKKVQKLAHLQILGLLASKVDDPPHPPGRGTVRWSGGRQCSFLFTNDLQNEH